jgi:hypothetical protein
VEEAQLVEILHVYLGLLHQPFHFFILSLLLSSLSLILTSPPLTSGQWDKPWAFQLNELP